MRSTASVLHLDLDAFFAAPPEGTKVVIVSGTGAAMACRPYTTACSPSSTTSVRPAA